MEYTVICYVLIWNAAAHVLNNLGCCEHIYPSILVSALDPWWIQNPVYSLCPVFLLPLWKCLWLPEKLPLSCNGHDLPWQLCSTGTTKLPVNTRRLVRAADRAFVRAQSTLWRSRPHLVRMTTDYRINCKTLLLLIFPSLAMLTFGKQVAFQNIS